MGLGDRAVPARIEIGNPKLACRIAEASDLTVAIGKQAFYTKIDSTSQSLRLAKRS